MQGDNCVIFTTDDRQELRVVFDPDGVAFFCGTDLAIIAGYEAPKKAINGGNQGVNRIDTVLRKVPWDNGMKRGRCMRTCFSAENAVKFLCRRPAPYAAIRWLEDSVIPRVQEIGEEITRSYVDWRSATVKSSNEDQPKEVAKKTEQADRRSKKPAGKIQEGMPESIGSIMDRLDNIILECALLKRDLYQARP